MIDFQIRVDLDDVTRATYALADVLEDPTVPLLRTGGSIRSRARKIFVSEGNGAWPALAESTKKRKMTNAAVALLATGNSGKGGERSIAQRIVRDATGAEKWKAKAEALTALVEQKRRAGKKTAGVERRRERAYAQAEVRMKKILRNRHLARAAGIDPNRLVDWARREVSRSKFHGSVLRAHTKLKRAGYKFTEAEQRATLRQHARRYRASESSTRMLGGLENTLGMQVKNNRLRVYSTAFIGQIHNDGGVAGNNAHIKARTYLELLDADTDLFGELLNEEAIEAWEDA